MGAMPDPTLCLTLNGVVGKVAQARLVFASATRSGFQSPACSESSSGVVQLALKTPLPATLASTLQALIKCVMKKMPPSRGTVGGAGLAHLHDDVHC